MSAYLYLCAQRVFKQQDTTGRGKIGPDDLSRAFKRLDYDPPALTGVSIAAAPLCVCVCVCVCVRERERERRQVCQLRSELGEYDDLALTVVCAEPGSLIDNRHTHALNIHMH